MSDHESDNLFREGRYDEAAARLEAGAEKQEPDGKDLLLYLLDAGLALHSAGQLDESIKYFREADKVAEIKDYTSLTAETATLLISDNSKSYKGEDFENVLISVYLSINYALEGNFEDALVEARRVNSKLYKMVNEGARKYKQNAFARYLSAIMYESQGNWNDAYIDYKNTNDLRPGFPGLGRDLWRVATLNGMDDEAERWDAAYHLTEADHEAARALMPKAGQSEIIVIYENGISPVKKPNPAFRSLPKFYPRFNPVRQATVEVNGQNRALTQKLEDIEATAIENLDEKYGGLIAKKIGGIVAKEVVGDVIAKETNSPLIGFLAKTAMYASDSADLRSWNLLPRDLQIARITVPPGAYAIRVLPIGGRASGSRTVQVASGKKVFVDFRYTP
jgi:hypothetical protein